MTSHRLSTFWWHLSTPWWHSVFLMMSVCFVYFMKSSVYLVDGFLTLLFALFRYDQSGIHIPVWYVKFYWQTCCITFSNVNWVFSQKTHEISSNMWHCSMSHVSQNLLFLYILPKHVTLFNVTCFAKHVTLFNVTCLAKFLLFYRIKLNQ